MPQKPVTKGKIMSHIDYGIVKDGGGVVENTIVTMVHTQEDERKMMSSILAKSKKEESEDMPEYLARLGKKADQIRPGWMKNQVRRRLAKQGATEVRPYPL
jgi:hypothetical protein